MNEYLRKGQAGFLRWEFLPYLFLIIILAIWNEALAGRVIPPAVARRAEKRSAFRRRPTHAVMARCPIIADTVYRAAPLFTVNLLERRREWLIRYIALLRMAVRAVRRASGTMCISIPGSMV
ncbi:MAG TPA: hypothetical protein VK138_08700 [Acidiferrobacterales bacterium]|nr:hypothetical protein [Acidiferrobacterales bacterium]